MRQILQNICFDEPNTELVEMDKIFSNIDYDDTLFNDNTQGKMVIFKDF